jgi:hypothetical protein
MANRWLNLLVDNPIGYWSPLNIPVTLLVTGWLGRVKSVKDLYSFMGPQKTMGWKTWLLVLTTFFVDDVGTAVGFQGDDQSQIYEGNAVLSSYLAKLVYKWKFFESETAAFRFHTFCSLAIIFIFDRLKLMGPLPRLFVLMMCILKPIAGWRWWTVENDYSVLDYFLFTKTKQTPYKLSVNLNYLHVAQQAQPTAI